MGWAKSYNVFCGVGQVIQRVLWGGPSHTTCFVLLCFVFIHAQESDLNTNVLVSN